MDISKKLAVVMGGLGLVAGAAGTIAMQTHAQTAVPSTASNTSTSQAKQDWKRPGQMAAMGTVSAVNGNTITITDQKTNTSYTVDASGATIEKFSAPSGATAGQKPAPTTITVSQIAVGDQVAIQGTVNGTNITATKIMDGIMGGMGRFMGHGPHGAAGTVTAVSGNTITLTGKDGQTYTIDASGAKVNKVVSSSVSDIAVGDQVTAQGSTSGSTVTATEITDGLFGQNK